MSNKQYRFGNRKGYSYLDIKGFIAQDLAKIRAYVVEWKKYPTDIERRRMTPPYKEKVIGWGLVFDIEDSNGKVKRYEIRSIDGYNTVTNLWLIRRSIAQKATDIINNIVTVEEAFRGNEIRLLTVEAESDPYKLLHCTPGMTDEQIKKIAKQLMKVYHPDIFGPDGNAIFQQINRAYNEVKAMRGMK